MRIQIIRFFSILSIIVLYTSYKSIQMWPSHRYSDICLTFFLFFVMFGEMFVYRSHSEVLETRWFRFLTWTGSLAMGFWATFIIFSLPIDAIRLIARGFLNATSRTVTSDSSNTLRSILYSVFYLSAALAGIGFIEVLRGPALKKTTIPIRDLNPSLQDLKLLQISDLHVGPKIRKGYIERVVEKCNATQPDLIFITGDIADATADSIAEHLAPFKHLKSRFGIFYVTGNHEYYWGANALIDLVKSLGVTPLLNENRVVQIEGAKLLVAGITDPQGGGMLVGHAPDAQTASTTTQSPHFKILLAHRPNSYTEAEPLGFDLQLSGHTHAGQFFPFTLLIGIAHKYYRGLNRHGRMWVYVNPGTGYWGPPNRLGVRAEISLLTLSRESA